MSKMDNEKHKKLEETFGLPHLSDLDDDDEIDDIEYDEFDHDEFDDNEPLLNPEELEKKIGTLQQQLKEQQDIGHISTENTKKYNTDVDSIYTTANEGYESLLSAALAMEPAQGAKFLNAAAKLLEIALRSKNSSMEKQIDMAKLQLEREKLNRGGNGGKLPSAYDIPDEDDETPTSSGVTYDRNELISAMRKKKESSNPDNSSDEDEVE